MRRKIKHYSILIILILSFSSCGNKNKSKVDYWLDQYCKCVNMPSREAQIGCSDTWRAEMKKDLNAAEQKECWSKLDKIENGDCSTR